MRNKSINQTCCLMLIAGVVCMPLLLAAAVSAGEIEQRGAVLQHGNLVPNPSFEHGTDSPTGWQHQGLCGSTWYSWDARHASDGNRSVGIVNVSRSCVTSYYWHTLGLIGVDLTNLTYRLSVRYRYVGSSDTMPPGAIGFFAYDTSGMYLGTWEQSFSFADSAWHLTSDLLDRTAQDSFNATVGYVRIALFSFADPGNLFDAEVRFDEVFFGVVDEPTENHPPDAPDISGPTAGQVGQEYTYDFTTSDPDGDPIYLWIQWGEGCPVEEWIGPYPSGETVTLVHTWNATGTYAITAKARDFYNAESDVTIFRVSMPVSAPTLFELVIEWLLRTVVLSRASASFAIA